ncbi:hypothetical protein DM586_19950 [Vibrio fluvialis]|uniref:glycosyltransferase family 4 protein n=1 Tax=Vibrio fluvialis TaxID=676 RepID=UPI00117F5DD2|nr:glycosyltransferase family 4 protein [Vibrio fluvialis]TRN07644.1 hypothetical protein DM586_19950 [Vibrio fluvialis]
MIKTVGVILPYAECYDSHFGGAIARWVYEVNSRVKDNIRFNIYSASEHNNYSSDEVKISYYGKYCNIIKELERKYAKNRVLNGVLYQVKRYSCRDLFWIISIFNSIKYDDIIVVHNRPKAPYLLRMLGYNGRIILHMHNSHIYNCDSKSVDNLSTSVDLILFCSKFLKNETLSKFPKLEALCEVIYNGVSDDIINSKFGRKEKIILFAGRIIESKGVIELINAFDIFRRNTGEYKLQIVGGVNSGSSNQRTSYLIAVENEINKSLFKEDIEFLGYLDHDQLLKKMSQSEILAVPSKWKEPFGMVALEGFVNNCKVIATSDGGMSEILGELGFYCDCNPLSIAQAIDCAVKSEHYNSIGYDNFFWKKISKDFQILLEKNHE